MKKTAIIILAFFTLSFAQEKTLKVEATLPEWEVVYAVIEQSNAPHLQVEAAKKIIFNQLRAQMDSTKKK